LPKSMADAVSKCIALLWQIFLMVGPLFEDVRRFCCRVRSITTDMGVERQLATMVDCLPDFYRIWLKVKLPASTPVLKRLFPRSLQIGGWKHLWDNVICRGLSSLQWFPKFLANLKHLVSFFRNVTIVEQMASDFRDAGTICFYTQSSV
jgi:hypothetical protein